MPNRLLFDSLLSSQRWNDLPASAQCFYVRLMLVVDDFGAYDGRESVIAHHCYPTHRVDVAELLAALHAADLIVRYSNAGKPYIALMRWRNEVRGKRKFPAPPVNNDADDLPKLQGHYGREIGWKNPGGTDAVSVLLDAQMRPAVPQPREWRLVDKGYAPAPLGEQPLITTGAQALRPMVDKPLPPSGPQPLAPSSGSGSSSGEGKGSASASATDVGDAAAQHGAQGLPATTTPSNGKLQLTPEGRWHGLAEARVLQWQGMFADLSVPDQVERAGQWLLSRPKERAIYEAQPGGLDAFLVRWLLREAKPASQ
jgi:hypothetical protein